MQTILIQMLLRSSYSLFVSIIVWLFMIGIIDIPCNNLYGVSALDVSFIPNDENAPLPLSTRYRDSLRKLCTILDNHIRNQSKLPTELHDKKKVLIKMCQKLAKDDANIGSSVSSIFDSVINDQSRRGVLIAIASIGGSYLLWNNRVWIWSFLKGFWKGNREPIKVHRIGKVNDEVRGVDATEATSIPDVAEEEAALRRIREAREARLRRFEQINNRPVD